MSVETTATTTATPPTQDVANPRARRTNVIQPHPHRAPLGGEHIPYPATTTRRIVWPYAISFVVIHALALLAFVPWLFSWTGVALAFIGLYAFGTLGINLCYHRLLTHRGFTCPLWFEHALATIGVCCLQDTPARWTMIHRLHHQHSDDQPDPHSPLAEFFWGHIGWLVYENTQLSSLDTYEKYVPDLLRDRFYLQLEKRLRWFTVYVIHAVLFYLVGFGMGWETTGRFNG